MNIRRIINPYLVSVNQQVDLTECVCLGGGRGGLILNLLAWTLISELHYSHIFYKNSQYEEENKENFPILGQKHETMKNYHALKLIQTIQQ